jgi:hypothetical protein
MTLCSLVNIIRYFRGFRYLFFKVYDYSDSEEGEQTLLKIYDKFYNKVTTKFFLI